MNIDSAPRLLVEIRTQIKIEKFLAISLFFGHTPPDFTVLEMIHDNYSADR